MSVSVVAVTPPVPMYSITVGSIASTYSISDPEVLSRARDLSYSELLKKLYNLSAEVRGLVNAVKSCDSQCTKTQKDALLPVFNDLFKRLPDFV